jgi:hypothetical protein
VCPFDLQSSVCLYRYDVRTGQVRSDMNLKWRASDLASKSSRLTGIVGRSELVADTCRQSVSVTFAMFFVLTSSIAVCVLVFLSVKTHKKCLKNVTVTKVCHVILICDRVRVWNLTDS